MFRAKGFFWLATRMDLVGGLNLAGSELHCAAAGQWWAARDEHTRRHEMPERTRKEWQEPFGDRRQAIALHGIQFRSGRLQAQLDACLLTDSEMAARPAKVGRRFPIRFLPGPFMRTRTNATTSQATTSAATICSRRLPLHSYPLRCEAWE